MAPNYYKWAFPRHVWLLCVRWFSALRAAFNEFDKDRDGYITSTELLAVMTSLRQNVTRGEIHQMIRHVDIDGRARILLASPGVHVACGLEKVVLDSSYVAASDL